MAQRRLALTPAQRAELEHLRDHGVEAYLREKADALLHIADGTPAAQVARSIQRKDNTVYDWLNRYEAEGVDGLVNQPGSVEIRRLDLSDAQRAELEQMCNYGPEAYLRERANALLQVADGTPAAQVARSGLSRTYSKSAVYDWLDRYEAEGVDGLLDGREQRFLHLSDAQRAELEQMRDHGEEAYLRERAAALLHIADGTPAVQVARSMQRRHNTVYGWLDRYEAEGIDGLRLGGVRRLDLSDEQLRELELLRDHGAAAYLREKADALLQVADGTPAVQVARSMQRKDDTVYDWLNRYEAEGVDGLVIRPGRGRMRRLDLSDAQRTELEQMRDHGAAAYLRERANALLQIADGTPASRVAASGLPQQRKWSTVLKWLNRYEAEGIAGLYDRSGNKRG
jgi:transposase